MRIRTRRAKGGLAFAAVLLSSAGLSLATAGPASAAYSGKWAAYGNTNPITSSPSTWKCATSKEITADVIAQVCAIKSVSGTARQGAVIVRNNKSSLYSLSAGVGLNDSAHDLLDFWACEPSGVRANSWSVCFGETIGYSGWVDAWGDAAGKDLGLSPDV